jgi:hypothetical protein
MGHWGVKSYENDDADSALDAAFDRVHKSRYDELMDDRNPMTFDQVHEELADPQTLAAAVEWLRQEFGGDFDSWDEIARLAFSGVVVRHAEFGVPIPSEWKDRAVRWLEAEEIEWDEDTVRRLRREKEIGRLRSP